MQVPSGVSQLSPKISILSTLLDATWLRIGKILFGFPNGSSPIKPDSCAPIGLKYLKLAIFHELDELWKISLRNCFFENRIKELLKVYEGACLGACSKELRQGAS